MEGDAGIIRLHACVEQAHDCRPIFAFGSLGRTRLWVVSKRSNSSAKPMMSAGVTSLRAAGSSDIRWPRDHHDTADQRLPYSLKRGREAPLSRTRDCDP